LGQFITIWIGTVPLAGRPTKSAQIGRSHQNRRCSEFRLLKRFAKDDGELGCACLGWIVEGVAGAAAFRRLEKQARLYLCWQSGETSFAVDVGPNLKIELVEVSVIDPDGDLCGVDRFAVGVVDGEVGGAWSDGAVDDWDGVRIGSLLSTEKRERQQNECG